MKYYYHYTRFIWKIDILGCVKRCFLEKKRKEKRPRKPPILRPKSATLRFLADNLDYKGEYIGLASAWEMVFIMPYYGMFMSLFHSIQICQAEGISLEEYIAVLDQQGKRYKKWLRENIQSGNYQKTSAPLELWAGGIQHIAQHAQDRHIHAAFPQLVARLFQQAMNDGYGREEVSALFKVLQK